jgi:hypothetical protein
MNGYPYHAEDRPLVVKRSSRGTTLIDEENDLRGSSLVNENLILKLGLRLKFPGLNYQHDILKP